MRPSHTHNTPGAKLGQRVLTGHEAFQQGKKKKGGGVQMRKKPKV